MGVSNACFELYLGDCLEIMKTIPDASVDMIACDLPYGVTQNRLDVVIPFEPLWSEYRRIIKEHGCIALFAQGVFFVDLVQSNRKMFRYDLVWDKVLTTGFLNAGRMPLRRHEQIAIFYKKLPEYHPQYTVGAPLHGKGTAYREKEHKNNNYGRFHMTDDQRKGSTQKYPTSIIRVPKPHPSVALHRTEKPVELLKWLICTYTSEGDIVMDNCMGAGGCGVACAQTDRRFIGIEKDPAYFSVAKGCIEAAYQQSL